MGELTAMEDVRKLTDLGTPTVDMKGVQAIDFVKKKTKAGASGNPRDGAGINIKPQREAYSPEPTASIVKGKVKGLGKNRKESNDVVIETQTKKKGDGG